MPLTTPEFSLSQHLLAWYHQHGRKHLPWQQERTPYRVWISEIMLQQTQVATVIPYYERFMASFPTVAALARAHEDSVLHHWTGLGYYARARNLHKAAIIIHQELGDAFPDTVEGLCALPGIGRSTAGAILALGHGGYATILDGNCKRVLTRYHCVEGWPGRSQVDRRLWELAEEHTPEQNCAHYTQAIMDLGATLCSRTRPACALCPLQPGCRANAQGRTGEFPHKKPNKQLPVKATAMLLIRDVESRAILLRKRPPQGIWGGLWSFPEVEQARDADEFIATQHLGGIRHRETWRSLRHTFSHYHLDITPVLVDLRQPTSRIMEDGGWQWYDPAAPSAVGLAAPVKKLLSLLKDS